MPKEEAAAEQPHDSGRCPSCGACKECGAKPQVIPYPYPVYPWGVQPYRPAPYTQPSYQITWGGNYQKPISYSDTTNGGLS